ncbi:MAG: protoporphyrinogen oxidase [Desulfobacterium sp.]|nr:protoporphyrinogen oxidase [Desulfobacterium sp.]
MDRANQKIIILGAGISGLATAHWLNKNGFDITIMELKKEPGGSMETRREDGFLVDYGPNSGLETVPLIRQLVDEVGLGQELIYADTKSNKRYILKNNRLHALPTSPIAFFRTKLFSLKAKLRLLSEPFIGKSEEGYYQSISDFVRRRLGPEFLDYAINPFVAGVYAGDPDELSVKSAFPKLYRLEEEYGGLIKGMIKGAKERKERSEQSKQTARMFSFKNGMQALPLAIAKSMEDKILYDCHVQTIVKAGNGYRVVFNQAGKERDIFTGILISAIPAYQLAVLCRDLDKDVCTHLNQIYYPPVKVLYLGFKKEDVGQALDGFGFLIPAKEKKRFLGAIWSSVIFPERATADVAAFTLFIGGARSPELLDQENPALVDDVIQEFKDIMKINADPIFMREKLWQKAIPQYTLGYIEHERYFAGFEDAYPGFFLSGNYRGGISVGDCIKNSELVYNRIRAYAARVYGE